MLLVGNYIFMFFGLSLILLIVPTLAELFPITSLILSKTAFNLLMVIGVWSLNFDKHIFVYSISIAFTSMLLMVVNFFVHSEIIILLNLVWMMAFCFLSTVMMIKDILFKGNITINKIIGSVCVYLLIGMIWGILYMLISYVSPNAINGLSIDNNFFWDYTYFSFITLTTVGYGDITPNIPITRSLAYLEAICGQFYLTILVASLVGAFLNERAHH